MQSINESNLIKISLEYLKIELEKLILKLIKKISA